MQSAPGRPRGPNGGGGRLHTWAPRAVAGLFFAGLWMLARGGPDYPRYLEWANVALTGNLFELQGQTLSPFGVPFSLWSHGPGFVFATSKALLGHPLDLHRSGLVVGWLAGCCFWAAMDRLLAYLARPSHALTLFGLALAFVATHAGFYSYSHASESLSLAAFAVLASWLVLPRRWGLVDAAVLGMAGGLVIIIRAQLAMYVAVALGMFVALAPGPADRPAPGRRLALGALAGVPLLLALLQVLMANRWMTGGLLASPYVYSAGEFRSVDFVWPEFGAVLLHPWHGLLVYHPLYALGFVALCCELVDARSGRERAFLGAIVVVLLAHLYLQAAHFCWWLGTATFGMRGLAVTSVVLVPAFVKHLARRQEAGKPITAWVLAATSCALWSYLLFRQGESNLLTYGVLLSAQAAQLRREAMVVNLVPLLVCAGAAWGTRHLWRGGERVLGCAAVFLSCLASLGMASTILGRYDPLRQLGVPVTVALGSIACVAALAVPFMGATWRRPTRRFESVAAAGVLVVFLTVAVSFARLALRTEVDPPEASDKGRVFRFRGTLDWPELHATYREYQRVPGFDEKKRRLGAFLDAWVADQRRP